MRAQIPDALKSDLGVVEVGAQHLDGGRLLFPRLGVGGRGAAVSLDGGEDREYQCLDVDQGDRQG